MNKVKDQEEILRLKKPISNFKYKRIDLILNSIISFVISLVLLLLPLSRTPDIIAITMVMCVTCYLFVFVLMFRYITHFIYPLRIYKEGIQIRSLIFLYKRYVPYEQILDVKVIKRIPSFYRKVYNKYPDEYIAITTKKLYRYEIWWRFLPEYKKVIMLINKQIRIRKKKRIRY